MAAPKLGYRSTAEEALQGGAPMPAERGLEPQLVAAEASNPGPLQHEA